MRRPASLVMASIVVASLMATAPLPAISAAGRDAAVPSTKLASPYELVVFEAEGCVYCGMFRQDVLPLYRDSALSREVPIRFINLTYADESKMRLAGEISIAPTVVLMREGAEVDRIVGYTGPFNFLKLVNIMMGRSE